MKRCPTCLEEFAEQFRFCPVDGTVLPNGHSRAQVGTVKRDAGAGEENGAGYHTANGSAAQDATTATFAATAASNAGAEGNGAGDGRHAASAGAHASAEREEYHLTFLDDVGLTRRLLKELGEVAHDAELTWPEFKRDPAGFVRRGASAYGRSFSSWVSQPNVAKGIIGAFIGMLLIAAAVLAFDSLQSRHLVSMRAVIVACVGVVFAGAMLALLDRMRAKHVTAVVGIIASLVLVLSAIVAYIVLENLRARPAGAVAQVREDLEFQGMVTDIPEAQPTPDEGPAGTNKGQGGGSKPKFEKPAGGGGGGRNEVKPASFGKLPPASLDVPQVRAPDPHPPTIKNPSLPVPATIVADPVLFPPDPRNLAYGDPKSKATETSSGPGTGGGIGTGTGGGVGPGEGGGVGPGRGGNTGGGDFKVGGGGPGGGGGGGDYNRTFTAKEVTSKAVITARPEPLYTEEARKNNVTGTVVLKLVLGSNGSVSNIRVVKGLPDGLSEKAIAAARQIQFRPAQKDGRAVSQWLTIEYNFNIY